MQAGQTTPIAGGIWNTILFTRVVSSGDGNASVPGLAEDVINSVHAIRIPKTVKKAVGREHSKAGPRINGYNRVITDYSRKQLNILLAVRGQCQLAAAESAASGQRAVPSRTADRVSTVRPRSLAEAVTMHERRRNIDDLHGLRGGQTQTRVSGDDACRARTHTRHVTIDVHDGHGRGRRGVSDGVIGIGGEIDPIAGLLSPDHGRDHLAAVEGRSELQQQVGVGVDAARVEPKNGK